MGKKEKKKFKVCDWCVLVGVFALFASFCTPGITQAVEEQKLSDMVDHLQIMRSQILLFKSEHNGLLPGQQQTGDAVTRESFEAALARQRSNGQGAYLSSIPENPYVLEGDKKSMTFVHDPAAKPTGSEGTAWWFNSATGEIFACDSEYHTNY